MSLNRFEIDIFCRETSDESEEITSQENVSRIVDRCLELASTVLFITTEHVNRKTNVYEKFFILKHRQHTTKLTL